MEFQISEGLRDYMLPCPPGYDVVYGLARRSPWEIYLSVSNEFCPGLCAAVYSFDVRSKSFEQVIDVAEATGFDPASGAMPHSKIHLCLSATSEGRLFAATHFTAPAIGQSDFDPLAAYRGLYEGTVLLEYEPGKGVHSHGRLVPGEGARISCLDEKRSLYYFLSYPRNHLYRYDYSARRLIDLGRAGQENSFGLELDDDGTLYTSDDLGSVLCCPASADALENTGLFLPPSPGRSQAGNYIRRMTRGLDGCFYGFTNKGARLFRLDPRRRRVEDLGVIFGRESPDESGYPCLPPAKAVVQPEPGLLYVAFGGDGIYADGQPMPRLVRHDLAARRTVDLGAFVSPQDGTPAWIPQCGLHLPERGSLYFGLQHVAGGLRLWEYDLRSPKTVRTRPAGEAYQRHVAKILSQPFGASVEGAAPLPFVRSGFVQMHELGWRTEDRAIAPGESAISDLRFVRGDCLYGVTSGTRGHLFAYRPYRQNRFTENYEVHPWDLGSWAAGPVSWARIFSDADADEGRMIIASGHAGAVSIHAFAVGSELRRYRGAYHSLPHWPPVAWEDSPFQRVAECGPSEGPWAVDAFLTGTGELLGPGPEGRLYAITGEAGAILLAPDRPFAFRKVVTLGNGRILGIGPDGERAIFRREGPRGLAREAALPSLGGPACCLAIDPKTGGMAFGLARGRIEVGSRTMGVIRLSQPWKVRALAWHPGGLLYGFCGEDDAIGEAFRVDPSTGRVDEIGILQSSFSPRYWMCHRCDVVVAGARGEMYFGEHDRISHLFAALQPFPWS